MKRIIQIVSGLEGYDPEALHVEKARDAVKACITPLSATEQVPISSFHFGSGYTSIGPKRYVFNWNTSKFPDAPGLMRRFHDAGVHVVANLKPRHRDEHLLGAPVDPPLRRGLYDGRSIRGHDRHVGSRARGLGPAGPVPGAVGHVVLSR